MYVHIYMYDGILFSFKKSGKVVICSTMDP